MLVPLTHTQRARRMVKGMEDRDKIWDNLTKKYLTTGEKLAIIRECNTRLGNEEFLRSLTELKAYLNQIKGNAE